jgi:hypothetical protein
MKLITFCATFVLLASATLIAGNPALSAEDHARMASELNQKADSYEREADRLTALALERRVKPTVADIKHPNSGGTYGHSVHFAKKYRDKASTLRLAAARHSELAKSAPSTSETATGE